MCYQCTPNLGRCAGAPNQKNVSYAPCCDSAMICADNFTLGWGSFCIERPVCRDDAMINPSGAAIAKTILLNADGVTAGLIQYMKDGLTVGSTTALIPEASDASRSNGTTITDGKSGDTDFPHGILKPIATVGERSVCPASNGKKIVGVPDGLGAYLADDYTIRVVVQSESYGPLRFESYKYPVNGGRANFTGSHVQYVDYDREMMSKFMNTEKSASSMVVGMGEMIENAYNLKEEMIGPRNGLESTISGAHYGNTNADGKYVVSEIPSEADWFYQSLCSAHLEEKHQWGKAIGLEDDIFVTNEEWHSFTDGELFVGLGAHAIDLHTRTAYALGVFGQGGYEKIVEINSQNPNFVMFGMSGYNGDFSGYSAVLEARNEEFTRDDGKDYVWTNNIVPFRIYVGVKGKCEDGTTCDDFLARNGLRYGQIYGFAIDMSSAGPSSGRWRDDFHMDATLSMKGAKIDGKWIAQPWRWDGQIKNFQYDASWDYQNNPPFGLSSYKWWTSAGYDEGGYKTEHLSPDPREGKTGFIQGSTAGYFGHLYVNDVTAQLINGSLPMVFDGTYYVYQGTSDITDQIKLGGKGRYADGRSALLNWDDPSEEGKNTFEDIDGLEVFADGSKLYAMIQEDSGNMYGERMFITSPLDHSYDPLTYYFVAQSGGELNTRMVSGVGVPAGTNCEPSSHEFSGLFDLSGLLRKDGCEFVLSRFDTGYEKRKADMVTNINDKTILLGLQAHNMACGVIKNFGSDRGGQWLVYRPHIPTEN